MVAKKCTDKNCIQETNIALIEQSMKTINDELVKINVKLDNMEKHYANKWVEKAMIWFITVIMTALITAVLALILK